MLFSMATTKSFAHELEAKNSDGVTIYYVWTNNYTEVGVSFRGDKKNSYENEYSGNVVIPEKIKYDGQSYNVTSIENNAFYGCKEMTSISLPNTIKEIYRYSFEGCDNLTSVHISDLSAWCKIDYMGEPSSTNPLEYAHHLFLNGKEITELNIPSDITSIKKYAFSGAQYITKVTFPKNLTSIGREAFKYSGLTEVNIPDGVTELSFCTFAYSNLIKASIPNSVTVIGEESFKNCVNLESIEIGTGLNKIKYNAFTGCEKLSSVYITDLEAWNNHGQFFDSPFKYGANLYLNGELVTELIIPNTITTINNKIFENIPSITSVFIPNSVISIGDNAFYGCTNLNSVDISNSVTSIGSGAFSSCKNLVNVKIGSGIKTIGNYAFGNCKSLKTMYCYSEIVPELEADNNFDTFSASPIDQATLYVVDTLIDDYKNANYWNRFGSILGIESSGINAITNDNSKADIFDLRGSKVKNTQKGINIIRGKNGNAKKIVVR